MVFFTCNACGQAIKKAQVEKHYQQRCRSCEVLSCMDCGKDFYGDDYKQHTQCISEDQKYGGKGYQAPQNTNKGEAKQEQWLLRVREAVAAGNISGHIKNLLDQIAEYPNIPRKKGKFENFVRNSLKVHHPKTIEQVWSIFSAATAKPDVSKSTEPTSIGTGENGGTNSLNGHCDGDDQGEQIKEEVFEEEEEEMKGKHKKTSKHSETIENDCKDNIVTSKDRMKKKKSMTTRTFEKSESSNSSLAVSVEAHETKAVNCSKKKKRKSSEIGNPADKTNCDGEEVKAKKKKVSKVSKDSKPMENVGRTLTISSKEKVGVKKKKKKKDTERNKSLSYSDGEVSFELKVPAKKKKTKKTKQTKTYDLGHDGSVFNEGSGLEEEAAKKSKKKKVKGKIKISTNNDGSGLDEMKRKPKISKKSKEQEDQDVKKKGSKANNASDKSERKKKEKKLKKKGSGESDIVVTNKQMKFDVIGEIKKSTSKEKREKKKRKSAGLEKLKSSVSSDVSNPLANDNPVKGDKRISKKKNKSHEQLLSIEVKNTGSSQDGNGCLVKNIVVKKSKKKKLPNKEITSCKIDGTGSHKKKKKKSKVTHNIKSAASDQGYNSDNAIDLVKEKAKKKRVMPPDKLKGVKEAVTSSSGFVFPCTAGSSITGFELIGNKIVVHRMPENVFHSDPKVFKESSIEPPPHKATKTSSDSKPKKLKKKRDGPDGLGQRKETDRCESAGKKKKKRKHEEIAVQPSDQDGTSSAEPSAKKTKKKKEKGKKATEKSKKTSAVVISIPSSTEVNGKKKKKDKKKKEELMSEHGDKVSTDSKKKKSKKHKDSELIDLNGNTLPEGSPKTLKILTESSSKKSKKKKSKSNGEGTSTEMIKDSKTANKTKSKEKEDTMNIGINLENGLTALPSVHCDEAAKKKKKKRKNKDIDFICISNRQDEGSIDESKKKKKKSNSSGEETSIEMIKNTKTANKTKSKDKEDALNREIIVTNGGTALSSVHYDEVAKKKKKKRKNKDSGSICISSRQDEGSIDESMKKKKKKKKVKCDSNSEKESSVKTGTESEIGKVDVNATGSENGRSKKVEKSENAKSFSTILPEEESVQNKTKTNSERSPKKKKTHKKSKESSDVSAETKAEKKKVKKSKKMKER